MTDDRASPRPATPSLLRHLNERTVLERIRRGAPISRADVARGAGLSKPTVSLSLQRLLEAGLVREVGVASGRPGRNAVLYRPEEGAAFALGLDLSGGRVRAALTDLTGAVLQRAEAADIAEAIGLAAGERRARLEAVVVGVTPDGLDALTLARLESALAAPVTVESTVNLAALGERFAGACQGVEDFAFLRAGEPPSAGLVLRGRLHRGRRNAAGAVGSLPFEGGEGEQGEVRRLALCIAAIAAVADVELVVLGGDVPLEALREVVAALVPYAPTIERSALGEDATLRGALALGAEQALERAFETRASRARSVV